MTDKKVLSGQTIIDMAVQELGDASRAFELAVLNGLSLTDDLSVGQVLSIPDAAKEQRSTVQMFKDKANAPASADKEGLMIGKEDGIEFWAIEKDFEVQ
jgi:hypothetical protein